MEAFFYKKIDMRNRADIVHYLQDHCRYFTMNTWNLTKSFANNVKLYNLNIPQHLMNKAYEVIQCPDWQLDVSKRCARFKEENFPYSMGFNGRSSGYLVFYPSSGMAEGSDPAYYSDRGIWPMGNLQSEVKLIQEFDKTCDYIRNDFIYWCKKEDLTGVQLELF
jgi:hypothetical protein